jgi:hypothetical protein
MNYLISVLSLSGRKTTAIVSKETLISALDCQERGKSICITFTDINEALYRVVQVDTILAQLISDPKLINPPIEQEVEKEQTFNLPDKSDENTIS